jgi:protein-tyrosine-phosphatase
MEKVSQQPTVIFVCEHGAAKSVIAAYFNKTAQEIGLDRQAIARGTNPHPELSQTAAAGLRKDGLTLEISTPQKLSSEELRITQQVIAFCNFLKALDIEKQLSIGMTCHPSAKIMKKHAIPFCCISTI